MHGAIAQGRYFLEGGGGVCAIVKGKKANISAPGPKIEKLRNLCLLKVEEKKVSLVFWFVAQEPRYGPFIFWKLGSKVRGIVNWGKYQYRGPWTINEKTKETLLSQTLKVEEKKVSLVFWFVAQEPRYGPFIFWNLGNKVRGIVNWGKYQYRGPWTRNEKTKETLLSQTVKVEENCDTYSHLLPTYQPITWYQVSFIRFPGQFFLYT